MVTESVGTVIALKAASYIFAGFCLAIGFRAGNAAVTKVNNFFVTHDPKTIEQAKKDLEELQTAIAEGIQVAKEQEG